MLKSEVPENPVPLVMVRPCGVFGSWRNVLLFVYETAPTPEDLEARSPLIHRMVARYPQGIAAMTVVERSAHGALPDGKSRRVSSRQIDEIADNLICGAVALEGDGIQFSLLRSLLRGTALVARQRFPYHFFSDVPAASQWVASQVDQPADGLCEAIDLLRRRKNVP